MKHTKILNSSQKVFGVYIADLIPLAVLWILLAELVPESIRGVELVIMGVVFGMTFYLRSKYRRGYIIDAAVNLYIRAFKGGIYVRKHKNNWTTVKKL